MENIGTLPSSASLIQWGVAATVAVSAGLVYVASRKNNASGRHYPPGPPKIPLIGNAHNFPTDNWPVVFDEWQKLYGDIVYVQLPGMPFFIINSLEIAQELLNKRAKFNSDRKIGYMILHLMGWNWSPAFMDANIIHGTVRTMFRRGIGPNKMPLKDSLIERNAQQLVLDLRNVEGNPKKAVVNIIGMTTTELAYGRGIVNDHGEEMIRLNLEAMKMLEDAFLTVWVVDLLPLLRFWPSWMPGGWFKRHGAYSKQLVDRIREWPFQMAIERHKAGNLDECLANDLINEFGARVEAQDTLANIYFAGVDTV